MSATTSPRATSKLAPSSTVSGPLGVSKVTSTFSTVRNFDSFM